MPTPSAPAHAPSPAAPARVPAPSDRDPAATAAVSARGLARIRTGHPWIFRPDVVRGPALDARAGGPAIVAVVDARGHRLGTATWAATARLALRMLTRPGDPDADALPGAGLDALVACVRERFGPALARRQAALASGALNRDAYRVVHAESDRLPGLIVDRYGDTAVMQTTSVAMDAARTRLAPLVAEWLGARLVVGRDDGSARDFEDLPRTAGILFSPAGSASDTHVHYRIGDNRFEADVLTDGKTGGFLDQADNHLAVAALAAPGGRVLDGFTYHGGFALALARRATSVLATDASPAAVARTRENARRNGLSNVTVEQADAFELLRRLEAERARFEVVVLDPPALAKRGAAAGNRPGSSALTAADRAYRELFLRGARLTAPGGLLVVCSCSGRVSRAHFEELVAAALADSGRSAQVVARLGAAIDHPELVGVPETGHLKCWVLRVL